MSISLHVQAKLRGFERYLDGYKIELKHLNKEIQAMLMAQSKFDVNKDTLIVVSTSAPDYTFFAVSDKEDIVVLIDY